MITKPNDIFIKTYVEPKPSEAEMDRLRRISLLTDTPNTATLGAPQGVRGGLGDLGGDKPEPSNIPHANCRELQHALEIDARSIWIECPDHKGLLASLVDLKFSNKSAGHAHQINVLGQIFCKYCGKYRFVRLIPGSVSMLLKFSWND